MTLEPNAEALAKLYENTRVPPPEKVQLVDKGSFKAEAVGHADATDLLLQHDPCFTWEPMARDAAGNPIIATDVNGNPALWIWLTVHGVTKPGVGTCLKTAREPLKELVGDALRNAAMRFGLALTLWSKTERAETQTSPGAGPHAARAEQAGGEAAGGQGTGPAAPPAEDPLAKRRTNVYELAKALDPGSLSSLKEKMAAAGIGMDFAKHGETEIKQLEDWLCPL